jgi:hypothetical protein
MSLSKKIAAEVDDLVKTAVPAHRISAAEGPHEIDLPVGLATPVGIECSGFAFRVADRGELALDDLKAWGNRIAGRITYLMEPLAFHEADAVAQEVILRSNLPTRKPDRRSFYEVRLKNNGWLKFDRVSFLEEGRTRQPVPCAFTNEVVERLVDDLVATAP